MKMMLSLTCITFFVPFTGDIAEARRYFLIERPQLGFEVSYELDEEEREGPFIDTKDTASTFTESLEIETKGWFYLPELLIYKLRLIPEWEQTREDGNGGDTRKSRKFFLNYSVNLVFLQNKPYTLKFFAEKFHSTIINSFAANSKREGSSYGGSLFLKYRVLPTNILYKHFESRQTGLFRSKDKRDEWRLNMRYSRHLGNTNLDVSYIDSTHEYMGFLSSVRQKTASLQNIYPLTEDKMLMLSSNFLYNDTKSNDFESTRYSLYENLSWNHSRNLKTYYTLMYSLDDSTHFRTERKELGFKLIHLLYENLTTSFNLDGSRVEFSGGREASYRAGLTFDYRRKIPWGTLNISVGHNYHVVDVKNRPSNIQIIDEPHILRTGEVTLLDHENVDISSIMVTDASGTIVYIKDIDYRISGIDSFIRISRIPLGSIADGQDVLVSYQYLANPPFDYSIFRQTYGINLNLWSALTVYYTYNHLKQSFISGIPPDVLSNSTTHIAGTEFRWKWTETRLRFEDTSQTPGISTRKWRAEETLTFRPMTNLFISLTGHYGITKFKDRGDIEKHYGLGFNIQAVLKRRLRLEIRGFRNRVSGESEKIFSTGLSSSLEWDYRLYNASIIYRYLDEKDDINHDMIKTHYLLFSIKRKLW
ncbi:MAG: hypothetical protein AB1632_09850 [Nitrospirota bacterium]